MSYVAAAFFLAIVGVSVLTARVSPLILALYLVASLVTFIMYAVDKSAAKRGAWRTQESSLHWLSLVGGWPGALIAQQKLRHKTQKQSFRVVFWITVLLNCGAFVWLFLPTGTATKLLDSGWAEILQQTSSPPPSTRSAPEHESKTETKSLVAKSLPQPFSPPPATLSAPEDEREIVTVAIENGSYTGTVKDGKPDGYGEAKFNDGRWYRGGFRDGTVHGHGTLYWAGKNRISLETDYQNGVMNGKGIVVFRDGSRWTGDFEDSLAVSVGVWEFPDGSLKEGVFDQDGYAAVMEKAKERATLKRGWYRAVRSTRTFKTPELGAAPHIWLAKGRKVRVVDVAGEFVAIKSADNQTLGYVRRQDVQFESEDSG